jgi:ankyrin repeat protein
MHLLDDGLSANYKLRGRPRGYLPSTLRRLERKERVVWFARLLLERGADVDAMDERSYTVLHAAVRDGGCGIVGLHATGPWCSCQCG